MAQQTQTPATSTLALEQTMAQASQHQQTPPLAPSPAPPHPLASAAQAQAQLQPTLPQPQLLPPPVVQPHQMPSTQAESQQEMDLSAVGKRSSSPPGSYARLLPRSIDPSAVPPILPPHLLQVILNNPDKANTTILPQPNHVMLNHLYALSIKDGIMVLSATHRFRKKYVTTLLYKPI